MQSETRSGRRSAIASSFASMFMFVLGLTLAATTTEARAQDAGVASETAEGTQADPEPADETAEPAPAASDEAIERLEARLSALEAREEEQRRQLERADERVQELERAAAAEDETPEREEGDAEGDTGPTIRPIGSMLTRLEVREGYADLGAGNPGCFPGPNDGECLRYRARVGLDVGNLRVGDEVTVGLRFAPQVSGFWAFGVPPSSGGVTHPALALYEGSLSLRIEDSLRLEVGRIVLNYGDQLVIGALGWHPAARSFDGARLRITPDDSGVYVDAFWTMLLEGGPGGFGLGDAYFYGIYAGIGPAIDEDIALDLYALGLQTNDAPDPTSGNTIDWSLLVHLGARFRMRIDLVDLRAEGGLQLGRRGLARPADPQLIFAGHLDGEIGLNLLDDRLRIALEGLYASGDSPGTDLDTGYRQLFPTAHAFLGLSDVMGARTNVSSAVLHVLGRPIPQVTLKLDAHVLVRNRVSGADNYAGTEGDLQVIWVPGAGLRLRGLYALFVPNAGAWAPAADPVHYVELELAYALP